MVADSIAAFALHHLFNKEFPQLFQYDVGNIGADGISVKFRVAFQHALQVLQHNACIWSFCPKRLFFQRFPDGLADIILSSTPEMSA